MKKAALALLALSLVAAGTGRKAERPQNAAVFRFPGTTSGPFLPGDSSSVLHCRGGGYEGGSTWACVTGGPLTKTGTVSSDSSTALFPSGLSALSRVSVGTFSDSNYFTLGSGDDVLDFAGDFSACLVYAPVAHGGIVFSNGLALNDGYYIHADSAQTYVVFNRSGAADVINETASTLGGPNILCFGRTGSTIVSQLNAGTYRTASAGTITPGTTRTAYFGRNNSAGNGFSGHLYEMWFTTTAPTEAAFTAIQQRFLTQAGSFGEALTVTRASTATYQVSDTVYTAPANVPRYEIYGLLVEPSSTNLATRSEAFDNATWVKNGGGAVALSATADQLAAPDGNTTADLINVQTATSQTHIYQAQSVSQSTGYTFSIWVKTDSGTKSFRLSRTDCASWVTASVSGTLTATTTWQRFSFAYATGVGETCSNIGIGSENKTPFTQSDGNYYYWGAQHETPGPFAAANTSFATSYIPTAGTAVARSADNISMQNAAMFDLHREGSWVVKFRPTWATANMPANPSMLKLLTATDTDLTDIFCHATGCTFRWGGSSAAVSQAFVAGTEYKLRGRWRYGGPVCGSIDDGTETCSANLTPTPVTLAKFWVGTSGSANYPSAHIREVCVARTQDGCR